MSAGTDEALRVLLTDGGIDIESAREWLQDALSCLEEPRDGFSVGNAANQTAKALVALGNASAWHDDRDDTHSCDDCGRTYYERMGSYWLAPDELWEAVVGDNGTVLCPACFARRARALGVLIHWRPEVVS